MKCRFSPSPTGLMHVGNARTALHNYLLAQAFLSGDPSSGFLLRIEDTDALRSKQEYTENLMADLKWLGLKWQEGPYFQSERTGLYEAYYQQLLFEKKAYLCFCTEESLAWERKSQLQSGRPPRYAGTCRHLDEGAQKQKIAGGEKYAVRFVAPLGIKIEFEDFIQGKKSFLSDDIGDFIIKKADGSASFMFCNALDDALMDVTHVMRGEDHLSNTPRQLLILQALGLSAPHYGHLPLILGTDGKPLSKRNGSQSVESLREQGYFPIAINNYLSRLGHHFSQETLLDETALGHLFSISHIGRAPARFEISQLKYWQKEALMRMSIETLWEWVGPPVRQWVPADKKEAFMQVIQENIHFPEEALHWAQCFFGKIPPLPVVPDKTLIDALIQAVTLHADYKSIIQTVMQITQKKGKALFLPLRQLLTAREDGPELAKIFALMGQQKILERLEETKGQV